MDSLQKLCEISLMRNYLLLQDVRNVPYRLIKKILAKTKRNHLCKLENSNVLLIFEDDELWLNFLKQDFPTSVHDCFVSKKDNIIDCYIDFIKEHDPELLRNDETLIGTYLQIVVRKDPMTKKYKMPYRMLYMRYQQDVEKKQEKSAERLRLRMRKLEMERQKNQTVVVDHSFYAQNQPKKPSRNAMKNHHSDLFKKSIKGHERRLQHFKSGGFDIAKRRPTRVAFTGVASNAQESSDRLSPTRHPEDSNSSDPAPIAPLKCPQSPPRLKKRRSEPPNIFLHRKRPALPPSKEKTSKEATLTNSQSASPPKSSVSKRAPVSVPSGHKKKSALFSPPSILADKDPVSEDLKGNAKQATKSRIFIFDNARS